MFADGVNFSYVYGAKISPARSRQNLQMPVGVGFALQLIEAPALNKRRNQGPTQGPFKQSESSCADCSYARIKGEHELLFNLQVRRAAQVVRRTLRQLQRAISSGKPELRIPL